MRSVRRAGLGRGAPRAALLVALSLAPRALIAQPSPQQNVPLDEALEVMRAPVSAPRGAPEREHFVIAQYREALHGWMHPEERALLASVDTSQTSLVEARPLRALLLDRAVRTLAPLALQFSWRTRDAARLRALRELSDEGSIRAALRDPAMALALRRREALAVAGVRALATFMLREGRAPRLGSDHSSREQDQSADRALVAAADCVLQVDASEAGRVAFEAAMVTSSPTERAQVISAAIELLREMVQLARGLPMHVPFVAPAPAESFDPFDPGAVAPRAVRVERARGGVRSSSTPRPTSGLTPAGPCMDRYDCYTR